LLKAAAGEEEETAAKEIILHINPVLQRHQYLCKKPS